MKRILSYWFEIAFLSLFILMIWLHFGEDIIDEISKMNPSPEPTWIPVQIGGNTYIMPF